MFRAETLRSQRMGNAALRKSAKSARKIMQFICENLREKHRNISASIFGKYFAQRRKGRRGWGKLICEICENLREIFLPQSSQRQNRKARKDGNEKVSA